MSWSRAPHRRFWLAATVATALSIMAGASPGRLAAAAEQPAADVPAGGAPSPAPTAPAPAAPAPPPQAADAPPPRPAAGGAPPPPAAPPAQEAVGTPATVIDNKQIESILGRSVLSPTGEDMGRIVDILADKNGELRAAVIDFGGFFGVGSRKIAVDWHALHLNADGKSDTIVADLPRNQLKTAPVYKDGEPVVVLGRAAGADKATDPKATDPKAPAAKTDAGPAVPPPAAPAQ